MFNYDLLTWIDYFIGAFACCFGVLIIGRQLTNKQKIKIYNILLVTILSIPTVFNTLIFDNLYKMLITYIIFFIIFKFAFRKDNVNSCLYSIAVYLCFILSEITISIITMIVELIFNYNIIGESIKSAFINIIIAGIAIIYSYIFKNNINNIIKKINRESIVYVIILGIVSIIAMATTLFKLAFNNWKVDYSFILNILTFLGFSVITFVLLKQYISNKEINDKYNLLNDYLKTSAELIEKYSTTVHKYKNNLIAIKGYLKTNENKANTYIDDILETYEFKKYGWFNKINNIKIDVLRYLIYYKLSKAENCNLKIVVDVSNSLLKYQSDILSIKESNVFLEIIGELFDNAIYACNESKEKEINVMLYEENNKIIFILSNTYNGRIDLSLICKNGYTTKGDGHGLGLYDIDKTIKRCDKFDIKYEVIDNYFVVTLIIDVNEKK